MNGLTYEQLQDDILDHICCLVEEKMTEGENFDSSYQAVLSGIGDTTLFSIQHETLLLLDKKFQKMKNSTYAIGLTGSILSLFGAFFKMMHWPGAGVLISLGFLLVTAVFLPLYFILSYREQAEKPKIIYPIIGYVTLAIILTGALFKIQHWPGANILLQSSMAVILIAFIPLYLVQIFKRSSGRKVNIAYVILLLIGISIVVTLTRVNISKYAIDRLTEVSVKNEQSIEVLESKISKVLELTADSIQNMQVKKVVQYSEELQQIADEMLSGLLSRVDQQGVAIDMVQGRDFRNAARKAFLENGLAENFLQLSAEYRDYLLEIIHDPVSRDQVNIDFEFSNGKFYTGWTPEDDVYQPLIVIYRRIVEFKRSILYAEYLALMDQLKS